MRAIYFCAAGSCILRSYEGLRLLGNSHNKRMKVFQAVVGF